MKTIRKIKISVTTREILIARSAAQDTYAGTAEYSVCPVCSSHLPVPMPVFVETVDFFENAESVEIEKNIRGEF